MKKINFLMRAVVVTVILCTSALFAKANTDFYAWEFKSHTIKAFDGVTDSLTYHRGAMFGSNSFTEKDVAVELWLYVEAKDFTKDKQICSSRRDGSHGFSIDVTGDAGNEQLRAFFKNTDTGDKLEGRTDPVFPFFFEKADVVDKWVHIAVVFSSTQDIARSYLNGEVYVDYRKSDGSAYDIDWLGNIKADGNNVGSLAFACSEWNKGQAAQSFIGKMADFRLWNTTRTDAEIKANYNQFLEGDHTNNPGLYKNFRFTKNARDHENQGSAGGTIWFDPDAGWGNYYTRHVLSAYPRDMALADETLTWNETDGKFEVKVFISADDIEVFTDTIDTNSIELQKIDALAESTQYYAKVRTQNNGFCSGWEKSDDFTVTKTTTGINVPLNDLFTVISKGNALIINSNVAKVLNLYAIDGSLVCVINATVGENVVTDLEKGVYILNNQKVVLR